MVEDWINLHATGLARAKEMERLLRHDVLTKWGGRAAVGITRRDCVDLFEAVDKRAPRIAEQMMSAIRGAFSFAMKRARLECSNPAVGVGSMKRAEPRHALTDLELKLVIPWLSSARFSPSVRDVMRLSLLTACRSGEACSAEWSEVDLESAVWTQPRTKTKNKRAHRVMLSTQAAALLKARPGKRTRWLFPSRNNRPILQKAVGFAQWERRVGCPIKEWTVHDLRRTALTGLARLGCPRVVQDRIANHTDRSIAAIYDLHTYDAEAQMWLQSWADHLERLTAKPVSAPITQKVVA
jgi:integrase